MHRLLHDDARLAARVADMLDLRYLTEVTHVQMLSTEQIALESRLRGRVGLAGDLSSWAWALVRDDRDDIVRLGRNLMAECYVRGMRSLAEARPYQTARIADPSL